MSNGPPQAYTVQAEKGCRNISDKVEYALLAHPDLCVPVELDTSWGVSLHLHLRGHK